MRETIIELEEFEELKKNIINTILEDMFFFKKSFTAFEYENKLYRRVLSDEKENSWMIIDPLNINGEKIIKEMNSIDIFENELKDIKFMPESKICFIEIKENLNNYLKKVFEKYYLEKVTYLFYKYHWHQRGYVLSKDINKKYNINDIALKENSIKYLNDFIKKVFKIKTFEELKANYTFFDGKINQSFKYLERYVIYFCGCIFYQDVKFRLKEKEVKEENNE
jgi:hypothetical protein